MRTREEIVAWLTAIMQRSGETPTALARRAGIAQSTLTRFLADENASLLSSTTIAKISHVAGEAGARAAATIGAMLDREAAPYTAEESAISAAVRALVGDRPATDPWVQTSHALALAGILPGDIMIVHMNGQPAAGDVVCAQVYDWQRNRAETLFRLYETPYLVAASTDPAWRKPLLVDNDRVIIKGVVTHVVRPLTRGENMHKPS